MSMPRRERQRAKRSTRGSQSRKAGPMPATRGDCGAGAGGEGGREAKAKGSTHLQQQLHHAQAVVFHCMDEWGAAAFNVLQNGGTVSECLQVLPNPPAASIPAACSDISVPLDTSSPTPTPTRAASHASPAPLGVPPRLLLAPPPARACSPPRRCLHPAPARAARLRGTPRSRPRVRR